MTSVIVIIMATAVALALDLAGIPAGAIAGAGVIATTVVLTEDSEEDTVLDSTMVSIPDLIMVMEMHIALQVVELEIITGTEAEDMPAMQILALVDPVPVTKLLADLAVVEMV